MTTRRDFIKTAGTGLLAVGASSIPYNDAPLYGKTNTKEDKHVPFKISFAGYTFRDYDLDATLEMMQKIDAHYLCIKDFHLPLTSTDAEIAAFHAKLSAKGVTGCGVGPIYMKTEAEADRAFDYIRRVGVKLLIGVPNYELLPYVDKKVKEYDVHYAIHIHGPDNPLYPNAADVINHVKDLDTRIGLCLDIAHDTRFGSDPIADLKKYHKRVFDVHLNDTTEANKAGQLCPLGRGIIDIPAFVRELRKLKYSGACNIELTANKENCFAAATESIGYIKGVVDATW
jgi:sugar phosphate isomerase/epimerase